MTYPHQMNCSHSDTGWCLECVNKLGSEMIELEAGFDALEKFQMYFGFARLYKCIDGWYVSNKTDEGIGGCDPCIRVYGKTPKEALLAAARFLDDPKIPAPIPCPDCGELIACHEFTINKKTRREVEYFCWNDPSCDPSFIDDICPACMGRLEIIDREGDDPNRTRWEAKCLKCAKVFPRGQDIDEEYPNLKMERIDLEAIGVDDAR